MCRCRQVHKPLRKMALVLECQSPLARMGTRPAPQLVTMPLLLLGTSPTSPLRMNTKGQPEMDKSVRSQKLLACWAVLRRVLPYLPQPLGITHRPNSEVALWVAPWVVVLLSRQRLDLDHRLRLELPVRLEV